MPYPPDETIRAQSWLAVKRQKPILLIVLHATRGDTMQALQYQATKNWFMSQGNNQGGWGSSSNRIISHEGQQCIVWPDDMQPTWSAGYGGRDSTWAIDEYAISFEMAQTSRDQPYAEATLARAAREVALLCQRYDIPPVWLPNVKQTGAVPTGITGHENTGNGRLYGKTDPGVGVTFDTAAFMWRVQAELHPMGPAPEPSVLKGDTPMLVGHPENPGDYLLIRGKLRWIPTAEIREDLLMAMYRAPGDLSPPPRMRQESWKWLNTVLEDGA